MPEDVPEAETQPRAPGWDGPTITPRRVAIALGTLLVLYRAWQLSQAYFWQDDFVLLYRTDRQGLSAELLLQDYNGHLIPGVLLSADLVTQVQTHRWLVAMLLVLVFEAVTAWLSIEVVFRLFGERWGPLLPLSVLLFSPMWTTASLWWIVAVQSMPMRISLLATLLLGHSYLHRPRRATLLWLMAAYLFGLFFWEKAIVVPAAALATLVLVEAGRNGTSLVSAGRSAARRLAAPILGWLVVAAGYAAVYLTHVHLDAQTSGHEAKAADIVDAFRFAITAFLTGLVGGPWRTTDGLGPVTPAPSTTAVVVAVQIIVVTLVGTFFVGGARRFRQATLVVAFFVLLDTTAVAVTRVPAFGPGSASDPRYFTEAIVVAALALGGALLTGRASDMHPLVRRVVPLRGWLVGAACLLFLNSSMATQQLLTDVAASRLGGRWVAQATQDLDKAGAVTVFDGPVPDDILWSLFGEDYHASRLIADHRRPITWNGSTTDLRIFDGMGVLRQADIKDVQTDAGKGPDGECGWNVSNGTPSRTISLTPTPLKDRPLELGYYTDRPAELTVDIGGTVQDLSIPAGLHRLWVFSPGATVSGVGVGMIQGGTVCIVEARVGTIWPKP
jgi:hypothetical protein